ncbi:unnamed protein product [Closterium sp. NIES-64]|nr:unnamed protein product [Closterium sp. NIES-64]
MLIAFPLTSLLCFVHLFPSSPLLLPASLCLHPSASTPAGRQQQKAWRSSGSSVASGRGEWWDDARPGLALLTSALAQPPGSTSATDRAKQRGLAKAEEAGAEGTARQRG